jgi:hypothetical protein
MSIDEKRAHQCQGNSGSGAMATMGSQGAVAAAGGFGLACPMFCTMEIVRVRNDC